MTESDVIQTGIYGLDQIFLGGILKGNLILVEGAAGTGKSLLGVEFIYRGITEHDEPGIIVVFETSPRKLIRDAMGFGWNLDELQQRNKLKIIFTSPKVLDQELRHVTGGYQVSLPVHTETPPRGAARRHVVIDVSWRGVRPVMIEERPDVKNLLHGNAQCGE